MKRLTERALCQELWASVRCRGCWLCEGGEKASMLRATNRSSGIPAFVNLRFWKRERESGSGVPSFQSSLNDIVMPAIR